MELQEKIRQAQTQTYAMCFFNEELASKVTYNHEKNY